MRKERVILSISLLISFIFIIGACGFVYKKGGINYLKTKATLALGNNIEYDNYYLDRKDLFENLSSSKDKKEKIVFLGDSLIDKGEWNELLSNEDIANRGINGDTTEGVLNRIDSVIALVPKKAFIMIGTNDVGRGESKDIILKKL